MRLYSVANFDPSLSFPLLPVSLPPLLSLSSTSPLLCSPAVTIGFTSDNYRVREDNGTPNFWHPQFLAPPVFGIPVPIFLRYPIPINTIASNQGVLLMLSSSLCLLPTCAL